MVISKVIIRVTPFRALTTLLITYLLSPLPLQVEAQPYLFGIPSFMVRINLLYRKVATLKQGVGYEPTGRKRFRNGFGV